jgi:hypothetical protein
MQYGEAREAAGICYSCFAKRKGHPNAGEVPDRSIEGGSAKR